MGKYYLIPEKKCVWNGVSVGEGVQVILQYAPPLRLPISDC